MANHDYIIDNQTFPATRTDLNNALSAIVSNNSSSSEPSTKYAYQWWYDTSSNTLKFRNADNDAWVSFAIFDMSNDTVNLVDSTVTLDSLSSLFHDRGAYGSASAPITYTVTVGTKTTAHPYSGVGSSSAYFLEGLESPAFTLGGADTSKPYYYKFDQADGTNASHPLRFYLDAGKTTAYTTGVTTNGTAGSAGAYTLLAVDEYTPNILYYQCSSHANMGNHLKIISSKFNSNGVTFKMPTADGTSGQAMVTDASGNLSFASISETKPTITSSNLFLAPDTASAITIAGTNFVSVPIVEAINSSTGAITRASAVTFTSATSINATFTLASANYFIRVENNDGNAVRSSSAILSASASPTFSTAAGSLGSVSAGSTVSLDIDATSDSTVAFSETTSILTSNANTPASTMNLTLNSSTGAITGTAPIPTGETTYTFTIRATDAESQTADRQFSITVSVGINNSGQFN
ncbi:hypothetical protein [uncultured Mediterranean phage uvMED]|nr:hypothetical protein [uncultured Mediterranean phage uvMED]